MRSLGRILCFLLLWVSLFLTSVHGAPIYVKTDGFEGKGQGFAQMREKECLYIVPYHVVENATKIELIYLGGNTSLAEEMETFADQDIVVLRLKKGQKKVSCFSKKWPSRITVENRLKSLEGKNHQIELKFLTEDGIENRKRVSVDRFDYNTIFISPLREVDRIFPGMSGSILTIDGERVGILMSLDLVGGKYQVIRLDHLKNLLDNFWREPIVTAKNIKKTVKFLNKVFKANPFEGGDDEDPYIKTTRIRLTESGKIFIKTDIHFKEYSPAMDKYKESEAYLEDLQVNSTKKNKIILGCVNKGSKCFETTVYYRDVLNVDTMHGIFCESNFWSPACHWEWVKKDTYSKSSFAIRFRRDSRLGKKIKNAFEHLVILGEKNPNFVTNDPY